MQSECGTWHVLDMLGMGPNLSARAHGRGPRGDRDICLHGREGVDRWNAPKTHTTSSRKC